MPIQLFTAKVSETSTLGDKCWYGKFELVSPSHLEFKAGQYILLNVPNSPQKKSYSIASAPGMEHAFELVVDLSPNGPGCQYIGKLQRGEEVSFYAPAGEFFVADNSTFPADQQEEEFVGIATGTGITPIRSMILDQLQAKQDKRPIHLFWGLRHEENIYWLDDFEQLSKTFPNFSFTIILSQPHTNNPVPTGHVTEHVQAAIRPKQGYYMCGNKKMVEEMVAMLTQQGVLPIHIHNEKFY